MASRLQNTVKNAYWSYISMIASTAISFVSRTVFIYYLGANYLGINGLFSNVLGILSFTDLGIGIAINYCLYKPVAENDTEKIKSYMYYYKWAYRCVAVVISVLGLLLLPFLDLLVKDPGDIGNIRIYYIIYLFNTVSSYFVSYKYSLVNADQKNYVYTKINIAISFTTTLVQILSLILWGNYYVYLIVAALFGLFQKIFISRYLDTLYPLLKEHEVQKLSHEEKRTLIKKIKSIVLHKIGDVSVHQTDNIIVSAFVGISTVGLLSNYNLIINTVSSCISVLFNSVVGSLGNLVATESREKQYEVFKVYRFIAFWLYSFTGICLMTLLSPFICLWIGQDMLIDESIILLIIIDYYMIGQRISVGSIKSAGGFFEQDQWLAFAQAIVNLVVSVALVKAIGLPGVFIGTLVQGTLANVVRPIIVYKNLFKRNVKLYFYDSVKYALSMTLALSICLLARKYLLMNITIGRFICVMVLTAIIPNALYAVLYWNTDELKYVKNMALRILKRE